MSLVLACVREIFNNFSFIPFRLDEMDVYSPSHPTDQDAECDAPLVNFVMCKNTDQNNSGQSRQPSSDFQSFPFDLKTSGISKSPDLSPSLSNSSNMPADVQGVIESSAYENIDLTDPASKNVGSNHIEVESDVNPSKASKIIIGGRQHHKSCTKNDSPLKKSASGNRYKESRIYRSRKERLPKFRKELVRCSPSKYSHRHSRSSKQRRCSKDNDRSYRRHSSSRSHSRASRGQRHSKSRNRRDRRSRSLSLEKYDGRERDADRGRSMRSPSRRLCRNNQSNNTLTTNLPISAASSQPSLEKSTISECAGNQCEIDETGTPNISENHRISPRSLSGGSAFAFQSHLPPLTSASNFVAWQHQLENQPSLIPLPHPDSSKQLRNSSIPFQHQQRQSNYTNNYLFRGMNSSILEELPPNLGSYHSTFTPAQINRFPGPPPSQLFSINDMLNPLLPFSGILGRPPPPPLPSIPTNFPFSTQAHFIQGMNATSSVSFQHSTHGELQLKPALSSSSQTNLLETLMNKVGLPTDGMAVLSGTSGGNHAPVANTADSLSGPIKSNVPLKKLGMLKSTANAVLSQLGVCGGANGSPPPPPPPLPISGRVLGKPDSSICSTKSSMPVLPSISIGEFPDVSECISKAEEIHRHHFKFDIQEMLAKNKRADFSSIREWQERIALEVKRYIKPYYNHKKLSREDCRTILKKSVNKVRVPIFNVFCNRFPRADALR